MASTFVALASAAFLGSWHCGLMCGPIAVAFGQKGKIWPYHLGRGISYVALGIAAGFLGESLFALPQTARVAAIVALSLLILATLFEFPNARDKWTGRFWRWLRPQTASPFWFGVGSAVLPCGWLWTFVGASAATASPWSGAIVMATLWASSLPALTLGAAYFRLGLKRASPAQKIWVARLLVAAGLFSLWGHYLNF